MKLKDERSGQRLNILADYDIQMPFADYLRFRWRSFVLAMKESPEHHWRQVPDNFADFRRFVRDQVYRYAPSYFDPVEVEIHPDLQPLLAAVQPVLYCFIHHGFFPLIAFVISHKLGQPCTTIGTAPSRNLSPAVNPDHLYWKYAFYHQARRWLGTRFIFSDESPRVAIDWLRDHGSLTAAVDVIEDGVERKSSQVVIAGKLLSFPETATRLARLSGRPIAAASLYCAGDRIRLRLGAPHFVTNKNSDAAFQAVADTLFEPYLEFPEQRFFDLFAAFACPRG